MATAPTPETIRTPAGMQARAKAARLAELLTDREGRRVTQGEAAALAIADYLERTERSAAKGA